MKLQNIFRLQKLYYLFFIRQVLSVGILKEKLFRIVASVILFSLLTATFLFNYNLFDGSLVLPDIDWESSLIRSRLTQAVTWSSASFIFIKLLFLKKGSFLQMTSQLPVTNRQRNLSLILFELIMIILIVSCFSLSYAIAFMFRFGLAGMLVLVTTFFMTCVALYLLLQLMYMLISYTLTILKLVKFQTIIVYLTLAISFVFINHSTTQFLLGPTFGHEGFHWSILFFWLHEELHLIFSILTFLISSSIIGYLILLIPINSYIKENNYANINIPFVKNSKLLHLYLLQLVRRVENYVTVILSCTLFIFLITYIMTADMINPLVALMLIALLGLYTYAQTDGIRLISYKLNYRASYDYLCLIFSQIVYVSIISLPLLLLHVLLSDTLFPLISYLNVYFNIIITIIVTTYAGILFPTKKDNPFSPFIGTIMTMIFLGIGFYFLALTNVGMLINISLRMVFSSFIGIVSWFGLVKLKEEAQYEKN